MALVRGGAISRSAGLQSAITKQVKLLNLKAVKRITITFDPLHENAVETRNFLWHLSLPKVQLSNPNCALKTEIVCDRRPGEVKFQLLPSIAEKVKVKQVNLNSGNLSTLELLQLTNKLITVHAPKEEALNVVKTKSEKKAGKKR
uniref:Large ribosomal subunit protein mL53 n=1 Tax=Culicoides sonorensis TaxID=179676 RepID=A0A336MSH9_CULSO